MMIHGRIVEVRFLHEIRNGKIVGRSHVFAKFEGNNVLEYSVFSYYADEIQFSENELIGLTYESAIDLFLEKDSFYLRN